MFRAGLLAALLALVVCSGQFIPDEIGAFARDSVKASEALTPRASADAFRSVCATCKSAPSHANCRHKPGLDFAPGIAPLNPPGAAPDEVDVQPGSVARSHSITRHSGRAPPLPA